MVRMSEVRECGICGHAIAKYRKTELEALSDIGKVMRGEAISSWRHLSFGKATCDLVAKPLEEESTATQHPAADSSVATDAEAT